MDRGLPGRFPELEWPRPDNGARSGLLWERDVAGDDVQQEYNAFRLRGGLDLCAVDPGRCWELVRERLVSGWRPGCARDPMNVALRLRELFWIGAYLSARGQAEPAARIRSLMAGKRRWLAHTIEHETPGNHPLFELYALWLVDIATGGVTLSRKARIDSAERLESEARASFLADGFHVELSTHYHVQVLRLLEEYRRLASAVGHPPSPVFTGLVERAWFVLQAMRAPGGRLPRLGDACYCFFGPDLEDDLSALDAVREGRTARTRHSTSSLTLDVLGGVPALPVPSPAPVTRLRDAGYLLVREDDPSVAGLLAVDAGPLGFVPNPGHGHADQLSFTLDLFGEPLLVDAGTYRYEDSDEAMWFKRALAHNTLWVDGVEVADLWRFFRWCHLPDRPRLALERTGEGYRIEMARRGYGPHGRLRHRRVLSLAWKRGLRVVDVIDGGGAALPALGTSLHLAHGCSLQARASGSITVFHAGRRVTFTLKSDVPFHVDTVREPVAHGYGQRESSWTIRTGIAAGRHQARLEAVVEWG